MNEVFCKNCGEPVPQTEGKREKEFCNVSCRSSYWQKQKRLGNKAEPFQEAVVEHQKEPTEPASALVSHTVIPRPKSFQDYLNEVATAPNPVQFAREVMADPRLTPSQKARIRAMIKPEKLK